MSRRQLIAVRSYKVISTVVTERETRFTQILVEAERNSNDPSLLEFTVNGRFPHLRAHFYR